MRINLDEKSLILIIVSIFIFLFGFCTRITTIPYNGLLFDPDSYYWYKLAIYFSGLDTDFIKKENNSLIYLQAYYPTGREISKEILFLPISIGYSFKLLSMIGLVEYSEESLMKYMMFFGAFFGALSGVVLFFLFREITGNSRISFFSSLIYLSSYAAFSRNTAGDAGQESLGLPFIYLWILFFLKALKQEDIKRYLLNISLSIMFCSLASLTWGGNDFFLRVIAVSSIAYLIYLIIKFERNDKFILTYILVITISHIIRGLFSGRYAYIPKPFGEDLIIFYLPPLLYLINLSFIYLSDKLKIDRKRFLITFVLIIFVSAIVYELKFNLFENFYNRYIKGEKGLTGNTVAYWRTSEFDDFKKYHGYLLIFLPLGIVYFSYEFYKRREFKQILIIFWSILSLLAAYWMIRLQMFLALNLAILSVTVLYFISKHIKTYGNIFFLFLIGIIVLDIASKGISYAIAMKTADFSVLPWKDAGEWIRNHTEKNALLIHWWDYGYYMQVFADRYTIVDGGNAGPPILERNGSLNRNIDVALAFLSTEEEFKRLMYIYNPDNLPTYVLVSLEELGKSWAINYHATNGGKYTRILLYNFVIPSTGNISLDIQIISKKLKDIKVEGKIGYRLENDTYYVYVPVKVPVNDVRYAHITYIFTYKSTGNKTRDLEEIRKIAKTVGLRNYLIMPTRQGYMIWVQIGKEGDENLLLAKLLPFEPNGKGRGLKHFKLVYTNNYVYIYKYIP